MKSTEVKKFLKSKGYMVRTSTTPTKRAWITAWVPAEQDSSTRGLKYTHSAFSEILRRMCLGVIYGENTPLGQQTKGGNVQPYMITMLPHQWETTIALMEALPEKNFGPDAPLPTEAEDPPR